MRLKCGQKTMDGLKGFPEAIETIYPKAAVQLCIAPLRYSEGARYSNL